MTTLSGAIRKLRETLTSDDASGPFASPAIPIVALNLVLGVGVIVLDVTGRLPLGVGDFLFAAAVSLSAALFRPTLVYALLVGMIPYEIANLAPEGLGAALRPYQLLSMVLVAALAVLVARKRVEGMFGWRWFDTAVVLIPAGGLLAASNAPDPLGAIRLSIILLSFLLPYFLTRYFVRTIADLRQIVPVFLSSVILVSVYALLQSVRFQIGLDPFETMAGRPNATFPEPDWFGGFLVVAVPAALAAWVTVRGSRASLSGLVLSLVPAFVALLITVARSAWLGACAGGIVLLIAQSLRFQIFISKKIKANIEGTGATLRRVLVPGKDYSDGRKRFAVSFAPIALSFLLALAIAPLLTTFDLFSRATSTGGLQEITVSCDRQTVLPGRVDDISELTRYGCRHIDLEDVATEQESGRFIATTSRPDPSVGVRRDIYATALAKLAEHPILGIGWGSIGAYLGTDGNGNAFNASNAFLEVWLGSGLVGLSAFLAVWVAIPWYAVSAIRRNPATESSANGRTAVAAFVLASWAGLTVFNLFNSGILLGYFWVFLAISTFPAVGRGDR